MTPVPSSFYRRPLPEHLIAFASGEGRRLFREALAEGHLEGWFALAEQFHTQADPAFCGLGSLVVALNALEIDPGRIWKGPWRWFGEELLDCCLPLEQVRRQGITLDELTCLARCNGAKARAVHAEDASLDALRDAVRAAAATPRGSVVVASYSRRTLEQTGDGHFSPVGGYHAARDLVLLMDVARFKYPPHWVPLERLWRATQAADAVTGRSRGWVVLERSPIPIALFFRVSLDEHAGELQRVLFEELPRVVAESAAQDAASVVAALDRCLGDRIVTALCRAGEAPDAMPAEHRAAIDRLIAEVRATPAFELARRALEGRPAADPWRDEALTMLLLAVPASLLAALPAETMRELDALREVTTPIRAEVTVLREQLEMLKHWRGLSPR